jgi:hypothetical protein
MISKTTSVLKALLQSLSLSGERMKTQKKRGKVAPMGKFSQNDLMDEDDSAADPAL